MTQHRVLGVVAITLVLVTAPAFPDTLEKISSSGKIVLGYRESSVPFSYLDANQQPIGYSIDICSRVIDALKAKLQRPALQMEYKLVTSATRIPLVREGAVDLECGSTTNNLDRQKDVAFSVTTFVAANRLLSKKSSRIRMLFDLKGKTVVSTAGTTSLKQLSEFNERYRYGMKILEAKDHAESFAMIASDGAVAFSMDDILLASLVANTSNPTNYTLSIQPLSIEPYGMMLRRDDPDFKKAVDDAIIGLFRSGDIKKIYAKWFTSPIPPKGVNLNVPMSDMLEKVIKNPTDSGNPAFYH
ncbi:MAG: amino acid ABC transporter substrate-binding protein [Gammaproteobacteria bacterium]|nr:amino acid ABC transporter substrate-binding protein [Gammaproteobacteria bacterium]